MQHQRIVIVGAGILGLSAAYALLKQGMRDVIVLEQAAVDHRRSTSHGLSRLLRFEYGSDIQYSQMVQMSLSRWKHLEHISKRSLYTRTGLLILGDEKDNFTGSSYHTLRDLNLPTERLSQQYCQQHFPQFNTHGYNLFTYSPDAGMLQASTCLQTLKELILDLGGSIIERSRVTHISHDNLQHPVQIHLQTRESIQADRVIVAVGPWMHRILGHLDLPIRMTRQYALYFANVPLSSFALHTFPAFFAEDLYGLPIYSTCTGSGPAWFKGASHAFGVPVTDPDEAPHIDERHIAQTTRRLYDLLPALQHAELAHIDTCIYDVSPDEDFVLDRVPGDSRIVFATGMSGHAFKFGLVLGELLASLLGETEPPVPMERFSLARFVRQRQLHTSSVA